jgi:hypothetical protein
MKEAFTAAGCAEGFKMETVLEGVVMRTRGGETKKDIFIARGERGA